MKILFLVFFINACSSTPEQKEIPQIEVNMSPKSGSQAKGKIYVSELGQGIMIQAKIHGLRKNAKHGFHLYENGDCSAEDASSAGSIFNPTRQSHGSPNQKETKSGNLGNIKTNSKGIALFNLFVPNLNLYAKNNNSVLSKALIVRSNEDDYKTQPDGASGARIVCGVIK